VPRRPHATGPRHRKPLVEIRDIEPFLGAHAFDQRILPQAGGLDIEKTAQFLVDQLHPVAGDRPLPADPMDIAMQCHFLLLLFVVLDWLHATHIGLQHIGHRDQVVFLPTIFRHRDRRAPDHGTGVLPGPSLA